VAVLDLLVRSVDVLDEPAWLAPRLPAHFARPAAGCLATAATQELPVGAGDLERQLDARMTHRIHRVAAPGDQPFDGGIGEVGLEVVVDLPCLDPPAARSKSWAYTEDLTRADLLDGEAHVSAYRLAFVTLTETALPQRESMKLLEKAIGDPER
jgi:hypothetical protein